MAQANRKDELCDVSLKLLGMVCTVFAVWVWLQSFLLCRSIRLGYNVLLLDSDVIVMDDPYKYFKHPPFKHITVLDQAESPTSPNSGLLYVQNAAPDGPAAFMFAGITSAVPIIALCKLLCILLQPLPPSFCCDCSQVEA